MTKQLPPLDLHAHMNARLSASDLERLGAVVFAVTRSLKEYQAVKHRRDHVTVWGLGCHPGDEDAQDSYDPNDFASMLKTTACVGEVGLDRKSRVPAKRQREVFDSILSSLQLTPRITSIHSTGMHEEVLQALEDHPIKGAVLHWWRGNAEQTARAIELDCWFSVNAAGMKYTDQIAKLPLNRILTETDHPFGDRNSSSPRQPGAVTDVEVVLAQIHNENPDVLRNQIWANLSQLTREVDIKSLLPIPVQRMIAFAAEMQAN